MIFIFFKTYFLTLKSVLYFFQGKNSNIALSGKTLLTYVSFRLPKSSIKDPFTGLRVWYNCLKSLALKSNATLIKGGDFKSIMLDANDRFLTPQTNYIQYNTGKIPGYLFGKDTCLSYQTTFNKIQLLLLSITLLPYIIVPFFVQKYRSNVALMIREILEITVLLSFLKKNNIKKMKTCLIIFI